MSYASQRVFLPSPSSPPFFSTKLEGPSIGSCGGGATALRKSEVSFPWVGVTCCPQPSLVEVTVFGKGGQRPSAGWCADGQSIDSEPQPDVGGAGHKPCPAVKVGQWWAVPSPETTGYHPLSLRQHNRSLWPGD